MLKDVNEMTLNCASFQGKPALFTSERMDKATLPQNVYCYDIRHSDHNWGRPVTLENNVVVNFFGSLITKEPIQLPEEDYLQLKRGMLILNGSKQTRLSDFLDKPKRSIQEQLQSVKEAVRNQPRNSKPRAKGSEIER